MNESRNFVYEVPPESLDNFLDFAGEVGWLQVTYPDLKAKWLETEKRRERVLAMLRTKNLTIKEKDSL